MCCVLQDEHSCWVNFDVDAMWADLNKLSATIAAEREAKKAAAVAAGDPNAAAASDEH
jgi:hypothetical protein